ncbi:UNVERIFIED_ORG: D-serine dehydratase [Sphingomonas sp. R1F5B]
MSGAEQTPLRFDGDLSGTLMPWDKGVPGGGGPIPLADVAGKRWNLLREDLPLPVAVLDGESLERNSRWMRSFAAEHGVALAPHGKTTLAPALFDLQMRDGAWGITVSTPHQIAVAVAAGHRRIFVANQLIGRSGIAYVLDQLERDPELAIYSLVDSLDLVTQLAAVAAGKGGRRALPVLVEMGFEGGRTGCRTVEQGLAVARAVAASPYLELAGVEGFEGIIRKADLESTLDAVNAFLGQVVMLAQACDREGLFASDDVLLSAGGSGFFDLVVTVFNAARLERRTTTLLRSGCYITHDSGLYTFLFSLLNMRAPELLAEDAPSPALRVWAYVQSMPEPGRAIVTMGKRDVGFDEMPKPELWHRPSADMSAPQALTPDHQVIALNDQHGFLDIPRDSPLRVGDMIGFGISHPCLTFDKWRVLHVIDGAFDVVGSIRTYF